MKLLSFFTFLTFLSGSFSEAALAASEDEVFLRVNQVGYLVEDKKEAILFSNSRQKGRFEVINSETGERVFRGKLKRSEAPGWGTFCTL